MASYKYVTVLPNQANFGFFVGATASTPAPSPYQPEVGGYYNLRGYIDSREVGPYNMYSSVEYRPLLMTTHLWIADLLVIQGCLFTDAGSAWGDTTLTGESANLHPNILWSAGLGLRFNFLHFAGAILRLDAARTINPDEGFGISFGVGQFF